MIDFYTRHDGSMGSRSPFAAGLAGSARTQPEDPILVLFRKFQAARSELYVVEARSDDLRNKLVEEYGDPCSPFWRHPEPPWAEDPRHNELIEQNNEADEALEKTAQLYDEITEMPVTSTAGLLAKLQVIAWHQHPIDTETMDYNEIQTLCFLDEAARFLEAQS